MIRLNIWHILGIESTKDEAEIKRAYLEKLPQFHPEEDQEGFRRLREAYEEALRSLKQEDETEDDTPSGQVIQACSEIYEDFGRRVKPEVWQEILDQDICQQIDMQQEIGEKLLSYLMDHYRIPHLVWKKLTEFFCWNEQQELLQEKFPVNFINFVINQSLYEDYLRYDLFPLQKGLDYEQFISNYFALNDAVNEDDREEADRILRETKGLGIEHLDFTLLELRYYLIVGKHDLAEPLADSLYEKYPDDVRVAHGVAQCWLRNKGPDDALPLFEKVLEVNPEHYSARIGVANCYFQKEDYATAKEKYWTILFDYTYDANASSAFYECNEKLVPIYETKIAENPDDQDSIYKLASCYHNCGRFTEGKALLEKITPEADFVARHHDIYAYALMAEGENEKALEHLLLWESLEQNRLRVVRQLPPQLLELDQEDLAWEKCEQYLAEYSQEATLYEIKAKVLKKRAQLPEAIEVIEQGIAVNDEHLSLHMLRSEIFFEMGNYGEALESTSNALNIYPHLVNMLLLRAKIFYHADDYEEVISICERIDQYELEDKVEIDLYRSLASLMAEKDEERAVEFLDRYLQDDPGHSMAVYAIKEHFENQGDLDRARTYLDRGIQADPEHYYFRIDRARIFRLQDELNQALSDLVWLEKNNPRENPDFYNEKGLIYEAMKRPEQAIMAYEKAIEIDPFDRRAYGNIASLYAQRGDYEQAVLYYTKQLAVREHPYYYISRGLAYSNLNRTEEEKADYLKTIELDPEYAYAYNNFGVVMYEEENFEAALDYLNKALDLDEDLLSSYQYKAKTLVALRQVQPAVDILNQGIEHFMGQSSHSIRILYEEKLRICRDYRRYNEALALGKSVAELEIGTPYIFCTLGYCAYEMHRDDLAKSYFDQALKMDQKEAETYCELGYFYNYGLRKPAQAIKVCQTALEIDPDSVRAQMQLANSYHLNRDKIKAFKAYQEALELLFKIPEAERTVCDFYQIGKCYQGIGELEKAEEYYQLAIEGSKSYRDCATLCCYESLFGLAELYTIQGELEKARQYYDQTVEIQPDREYIDGRDAFLAKGKGEKKGFLDFFRRKK